MSVTDCKSTVAVSTGCLYAIEVAAIILCNKRDILRNRGKTVQSHVLIINRGAQCCPVRISIIACKMFTKSRGLLCQSTTESVDLCAFFVSCALDKLCTLCEPLPLCV